MGLNAFEKFVGEMAAILCRGRVKIHISLQGFVTALFIVSGVPSDSQFEPKFKTEIQLTYISNESLAMCPRGR